jgi:hypothetical protein
MPVKIRSSDYIRGEIISLSEGAIIYGRHRGDRIFNYRNLTAGIEFMAEGLLYICSTYCITGDDDEGQSDQDV